MATWAKQQRIVSPQMTNIPLSKLAFSCMKGTLRLTDSEPNSYLNLSEHLLSSSFTLNFFAALTMLIKAICMVMPLLSHGDSGQA